jgi:chemotaxis protein MotA
LPALLGLGLACYAIYYVMDVTKLPIAIAFFGASGNPPFGEIIFVLGGTVGAGICRASFSDSINVIKGMIRVFLYSPPNLLQLVNEIVELANINRRDGPIAMQNVEIKHPLLKNATDMVVDGVDGGVIESTLTTDIALAREREKNAVDYLKFLAEVAPSMGMVGTMVGLVAMLKTMDDLGSIGDSFAIALLTTMWGAIFAYVLFKPFAEKLDLFSKTDLEAGMLIKEGMLLVKANTNPRVIADRLSTRLAPKARAELAAAQESA